MMNGEQTFFDRLVELPLFQGIGRKEFMNIVGRNRLSFSKCKNGASLVCEDELCASLVFVLNGNFAMERVSDDRTYRLVEWQSAPAVLQPENLFGLRTRYTATVRAVGDVHLLEIDKRSVAEILSNFEVFRINFFNLVSTQAQQNRRRLWKTRAATPETRFAQFVVDRSTRPAGHKTVHIGMVRLAEELGETRLTVSRMLRRLEERKLLQVGRQRIDIPLLERLVQELPAFA